MNTNPETISSDLKQKLKWLIISRFLFAVLLLGSTMALRFSEDPEPVPDTFLYLYGVIFAIFLCSAIYTVIFRFYKNERHQWPAYLQVVIDTVFLSAIIRITGGYISFFSFLYLLVIMVASILLYKKGSLIIATICSMEYGLILYLEKVGWLNPIAIGQNKSVIVAHSMEQVFYKVLITGIACFAVAILSGLLAEQTKNSKSELLEMEDHIKRVKRMAYIGQMAANLAHEIKNPLASLAGSIQLLREEIPYDANSDKLMQIVLRETDRLSTLSSNFLFFAKPPTGKLETIKLDKAIEETLTLFEKDTVVNHRIFISAELAPDSSTLMDPVHLHQVLFNLLLNAAEAIQEDGIIRVRMIPTKNGKLEIEVSDNGRGIPEESKEFIFDPFYTTKPSGTGLGLSIVHSVLESYGSRLVVESSLHKGTTVRFQLNRK